MLRHVFRCLTFVVSISPSVVLAAADVERVDLCGRRDANDLARVSVQIEVGGHNLVQTQVDTGKDQAEQRLPMSVAAKLQYDERRLNSLIVGSKDDAPLAVRYYHQAEAVIKAGDSGRTSKLDEDRRLIVTETSSERPELYCPDGPLTRQQLDLIDVVGDSLAFDRLLPGNPVAKDQAWSNDSAAMAQLLTLDSVAVCEVKSILESFNSSYAKIRMAGSVQGTADGAATELELRAVFIYDRTARRVTRFNLAVRERRSIGGATPGIEAVAKLQIRVEPLTNSDKLSDGAIAKATVAAHRPARVLVYESAPLGLRCEHDRHWFVTSEQRETVTMRRVERGDLIAQCTLAALPAKSADRQASLEQFQKDVTFSLGKNFGEIVSTREWQNAAGLYCYELVARGFVEEVPVEWHYFLLAPQSGERVSVAITLEKPMVDRIGQADRALVESMKLFPRMPAVLTATRTTSGEVK